MVSKDVVQKRVIKAKGYLDFLRDISEDYDLAEFKNDKMVHGSSERFLHC